MTDRPALEAAQRIIDIDDGILNEESVEYLDSVAVARAYKAAYTHGVHDALKLGPQILTLLSAAKDEPRDVGTP